MVILTNIIFVLAAITVIVILAAVCFSICYLIVQGIRENVL